MNKVQISIVVPCLNEQEFIGNTLDTIAAHAQELPLIEVILLDSGSIDRTAEIAKNYAFCQVFAHSELKGKKYALLNQGAQYARGEILVFLDADTLLPVDYDSAITQVISAGYGGGAFEFSLDERGIALRFIEFVNRIRYRLGQRYYGDQAGFCTKAVFDLVDGFPKRPILESAHFCKKLLKVCKLHLITKKIITSSRRFTQHRLGPLWVLMVDTRVFLLDKLGFHNRKFAKKYWQFNESSED